MKKLLITLALLLVVIMVAMHMSAGVSTSRSLAITVLGPLPVPPATATFFDQVQNTSSPWQSCSDCAGGSNVTTDFWTAPFQSTPSMTGSSREFHVGGPQWTAALFYHKLNTTDGQFNNVTHFLADYWFYVDPTSQQHVHTLEFDMYQVVGGFEYMIGTHCSFEGGWWYGWNQVTGQWIKLNAPCNTTLLPPGKWHRVQWYFERIPGSTNYKYDTLVVDGATYTINLVEPASPSNWSNVTGIQWQIDTNALSGSANEWIDNVKVWMW